MDRKPRKPKTNQDHTSVNTSRLRPNLVQNSKMEQIQQKSNDNAKEHPLNYDIRKILHLWLAQVLPGDPSKFKYNLKKGVVIGLSKDCEEKLEQCAQWIQKRKIKLTSEIAISENHKIYLKIFLDIKIFDTKDIEKACKHLVENYKLIQLKGSEFSMFNKQNVHLMSILKEEQQQFTKLIQFIQNRQITRQDIEKAKLQKYGYVEEKENNRTRNSRRRKNNDKLYIKTKKKYVPKQVENKNDSSKIIKYVDEDSSEISSHISCSDSDSDEDGYQEKIEKNCSQQDCQEQESEQGSKIIEQFSQIIKDHDQKRKEKIEEKPEERTFKKPQITCIYHEEFKKAYLNLDKFINWIELNRNLSLDEFKFPEVDENIAVEVYTKDKIQKKQSTLRFYLHHSRFLYIKEQNQNEKFLSLIKSQLAKMTEKYCACRIFEGYVKQNTTEAEIIELYKEKKVQFNPSKKNSKKVYFINLNGIKPNVEQCERQIKQSIQDVGQNPYKEGQIAFNLPHIQPYLESQKLIQKLSQIINKKIESKNYYDLKQLTILNRFESCPKFTIQFEVKKTDYDRFVQQYVPKIQKQINDQLVCEQIAIEQEDLSEELCQKYLLLPSNTSLSNIVLIVTKDNIVSAIKQINQTIYQQTLENKIVNFKKIHLQKLKEYVLKQEGNSNVKYHIDEQESNIRIIAVARFLKKATKALEEYMISLSSQILEKKLLVSEAEVAVIEKNIKKFQNDLLDEFKVTLQFNKNVKVGARISLGPGRQVNSKHPVFIQVRNQNVITQFPPETMLIFSSKEDLNYLHQKIFNIEKTLLLNQNKVIKNDHKALRFFFSEGENGFQQSISYSRSQFQDEWYNYVFFMPKNEKAEFVQKIAKLFSGKKYFYDHIKVLIYDSDLIQSTEKSLLPLKKLQEQCLTKSKVIYYVKEPKYVIDERSHMRAIKEVNHFYSQQGNKKIQEALRKNDKKVYLSNEDLNLSEATHICSLRKEYMIHLVSEKQTKLNIYPDRVGFIIDGVEFAIPAREMQKLKKESKISQWVKISLGVYLLDFVKNTQKNLFSGYERALSKKQVQVKNPFGDWLFNIDFEQKINQITIPHTIDEEEQADQARKKIRELIQKLKIKRTINLTRKLAQDKFDRIKEDSKDYSVEVTRIDDMNIEVSGFDKKQIDLFVRSVQLMLAAEATKVEFPSTWQDQKEPIETFVVPPNSDQFKEVAAHFGIFPIKQLLRIQNKVVYKKFYEEKEELKRLNEGKPVKEMMLFHGTNKTDPKIIYEDKQECFNINYTSQNNYLGKGTYFAEQALYSVNYQHQRTNEKNQVVKSMFYCKVLVGESKKFLVATTQTTKIRDTVFKDEVNRIKYQSNMMYTNNSNIYAVYKNRRAYPSYLISY